MCRLLAAAIDVSTLERAGIYPLETIHVDGHYRATVGHHAVGEALDASRLAEQMPYPLGAKPVFGEVIRPGLEFELGTRRE